MMWCIVESPSSGRTKVYIGATQQPIKNRIAQHRLSFRHERYKESTTLAKHVWDIKNKHKKEPNVRWRIICKAPSHDGSERQCMLCLQEKLKIAEFDDPEKLLNSRSKLTNRCRHKNKHALFNMGTGIT